MKGLRYNSGKLRVDLIPVQPMKYLAEVYTKGAHKYSIYEDENGNKISGKDISIEEVATRKLVKVYDGANNWRNGLSWTETMGAVKRHIMAWDQCQTLDPELGTRHLANAAWGLFSLMEFEQTKPQFDDRIPTYMYGRPKVGCDIDEVLCDWITAWRARFGYDIPEVWNFSYENSDHFKQLVDSGELESFYLNLPRKISPLELHFEPHCYITSRSVPVEITKAWIQKNGFPTVPVYSVGFGQSKVEAAKASGIDIFVDDNYHNFLELNRAGICTFLLDAPHNRRYDAGSKRIMSLKDLPV